MNDDVRLLALRLLLDGCTLRLNSARKGFREAEGAGYKPYAPSLDDWEWDGATARLQHNFVFEDGGLTVYSYCLDRPDPYTGKTLLLAYGPIDGAPCHVKVKGSRIEIRGIVQRME